MKILVWDIPIRIFHWLFAGAFAVAWLTSDSDSWLNVHVFSGYLMLGLLSFRLVWGFIGGRYSRFTSFLYNWKEGVRVRVSGSDGQQPNAILGTIRPAAGRFTCC